MPIAAAVPALISAGATIGSAVIGSRAAKGAAQTQSDAAAAVARNLTETGERAASDVTQAGERAASETEATAREAAEGYRLSADEANALLRSIYGDAVQWLEPYRGAGTAALSQLGEGLAKGGEFNREFTAADMEALDPGYAFRLAEGQKALERSAAARGTLLGGGTLKALTRYAQGVASDEFGRAFDRFRANRLDRFNMLNTLSGLGLRATEGGILAGQNYGRQASGNIMDAGRWGGETLYKGAQDAGQFRLSSLLNAGRFRTDAASEAGRALLGGADARAAGQIAAANAWQPVIPTLANLALRFVPSGGRKAGGGVYDAAGNYIGE